MFKDSTLASKRVLITGGGTGLGKEIAKGLLSYGAEVYICGRRESVLQETVAELSKIGSGKIQYRVTDIRDPDAIEAMVASIWEEGPLTGLINNAAANFISPTKDLSPRGYQAIRSTVMDGAFYTVLAIGKRWIKEGIKGSIVSNLVTWVWTGSAYVVPSAMAKTAIDSMTNHSLLNGDVTAFALTPLHPAHSQPKAHGTNSTLLAHQLVPQMQALYRWAATAKCKSSPT